MASPYPPPPPFPLPAYWSTLPPGGAGPQRWLTGRIPSVMQSGIPSSSGAAEDAHHAAVLTHQQASHGGVRTGASTAARRTLGAALDRTTDYRGEAGPEHVHEENRGRVKGVVEDDEWEPAGEMIMLTPEWGARFKAAAKERRRTSIVVPDIPCRAMWTTVWMFE